MANIGLGSRSTVQKDLALVPTRAILGATMLYHGLQKLGREKEEKHAPMFESVGLRPARPLVRATGIAETVAGALSVLGLLTRPAALAVLVTQGVAVAKVHAKKGFAAHKGGYEFNLALMAIAAALLVAGPGRFSTHEVVERRLDARRGRGLFGRLFAPRRRGFGARLARLIK
jgi:putative oxidoreductase